MNMRLNLFLPPATFRHFLCYPESFGHYAHEPDHYEYRPNGLSNYNWHIVRGGKGYVRIGDRVLELRGGTGFLYGPGVPQFYYADRDDPWDIRWIHFNTQGMESVLQGRGEREPWIFSWAGVPRMDQLWSELLGSHIPPLQEEAVRISAILYEMLNHIVLHAETIEGMPNIAGKDKLVETADWIRAHCGEPLTLEQMAAHANCSPSHFCRQFHRLMGKSPIAYLTECRILRAKSMLVSTNLTLKDIAKRIGFSSSSYFIHIFRKMEGVTPEQFRYLRGAAAGNDDQYRSK